MAKSSGAKVSGFFSPKGGKPASSSSKGGEKVMANMPRGAKKC